MGQSTLAAIRAKARRRNREHLKRSAVSDITAEQELAMRLKARNCPLCGARLTAERGLPNSKHLDHVIPIGIGGTHTHGNVRIICRTCNLRRPKDGSDYNGPVTLWALGELPVKRPRKKHVTKRAMCRNGLHPWVPENIKVVNGKKRCGPCRQESERERQARHPERNHNKPTVLKACKCGAMFAAAGRTAMCANCIDNAAHRAAELHRGGMTWKRVAVAVGYSSAEGARYAAKRIGYVPGRPHESASKNSNKCPAGEPPES